MKSSISSPAPPSADKIFLALGQTLYVCQLFEATMLEVLAVAHELLDGTGDGRKYQASLETLSRKTLGQLLHDLRKSADIKSEVDSQLDAGLEARNFVVHRFAEHLGEDLIDESKAIAHQRTLYEKCALVMTANDTGLALLHAIGHMNSTKSSKLIAEFEETVRALRDMPTQYSEPRH